MCIKITSITKFLYNCSVEISDTEYGFFHRIVQGEQKGAWANFTSIASLVNMRHCSNYYLGILPTETLFSVKIIEKE